jgi:hypothetical protein
VRNRPHEHVGVGGAEDRVAQADRAVGVQAEEVGGREHPADAPGVEHGHVLHPGGQHVDGRLDGELADGHRRRGRAGELLDGPLGREAAVGDGGAHVGVGEDADGLVGHRHEQRLEVLVPQPPRRGAQSLRRPCVHGRAHDGRDRRRADVMQPVDRMPGAGEALAQRAGHIGHARLGGQHSPRGAGREQGAAGGLARAYGERGRHAGEQRRVPEALTGLEHLDDLARVHDVHRPGDDNPQAGGGRPVLHQQHGARLVLADGGLGGQLAQLLRGQRVKRRVPGEECVQVVHVRHRNCVRMVPCDPTATCQGKPSNDQRTWRAHAGRNDAARTI